MLAKNQRRLCLLARTVDCPGARNFSDCIHVDDVVSKRHARAKRDRWTGALRFKVEVLVPESKRLANVVHRKNNYRQVEGIACVIFHYYLPCNAVSLYPRRLLPIDGERAADYNDELAFYVGTRHARIGKLY